MHHGTMADSCKTAVMALTIAAVVLAIQPSLMYADSPDNTLPEVLAKEIPGTEIVIVLDNSGSMVKHDPGFITRQVVRDFLEYPAHHRHIGMVIFDENARLVVPLTDPVETAGRKRFEAGMAQITYKGRFTHTAAGVERAIYELKENGRAGAQKVIVLLTDGIIDTGNKSQDLELERWLKNELAEESRQAGIRIYGIAFTDQADFHLIQAIALKTEGKYFRAYTAADIPQVVRSILSAIAAPAVATPAPPPAPEAAPAPTPTPKTVGVQAPPPQPPAPVVAPPPTPATTPSPETQETRQLPLYFSIVVLVVVLIVVVLGFRRRLPTASSPSPPAAPEAVSNGKAMLALQAELIDADQVVSSESLSIPLKTTSVSIGRDDGNDIVIPRDEISSMHASIDYRNGYFYLEDHRSTNGTRLNGQKIGVNMPVRLKSGDKIHFADVEFRFLLPDHAPLGETVMLKK